MIPKINAPDEEDKLEALMKPTGCLELHYKVQDCIAETKDWRKCQAEVENFKKCMESYQERRQVLSKV